jgi:hypothetical protein
MPEATLEMTPSHVPPEIQAAQRMMAQIAVKILTQKRQKTHEQ